MLHALTRGVSATLPQCQLTHIARQPIDVELARQQHRAYEEALRELGAAITSLPPLDQMPDAVFVEDTAVVLDEVLVPCRMGSPSRAGEVFSVAEELAFRRRVLSLPPAGTLEGGDVLRIGKTLYVGLSKRTTQEGIDGLREILLPYGYQVIPVRVSRCLHLKSAASYLGRNIMLVNSSWVDVRPFKGYEIIEVLSSEPRGANVLMIKDTPVVPASHISTQKLLQRLGFIARLVDISELLKAESGVTCSSIIFEDERPPRPTIR
jgi:dimethylargininase